MTAAGATSMTAMRCNVLGETNDHLQILNLVAVHMQPRVSSQQRHEAINGEVGGELCHVLVAVLVFMVAVLVAWVGAPLALLLQQLACRVELLAHHPCVAHA